MPRLLKPSRPTRDKGFAYRIGWWIGRIIVWFLAISVGLTLLFKYVPVPVTLTMIVDPNGFTKDWTPLSRIDRNMVAAVIAGEDGKFCSHSGFDTAAMQKAWERNQRGGRIRGGSTISQQTAKNVFLWQGGGYFRKGLEAWFTLLIENIWGKRRIMEVYLNVAETGIGTYGVDAILECEDIRKAMTSVVLSANDPVAAWGGVKLLRDVEDRGRAGGVVQHARAVDGVLDGFQIAVHVGGLARGDGGVVHQIGMPHSASQRSISGSSGSSSPSWARSRSSASLSRCCSPPAGMNGYQWPRFSL